MGTKVFQGRCSVVWNTKDEIALQKDSEGNFSATNVAELDQTLMALSKELKAPIHKYARFVADGGTVPVLIVTRWGAPQVAVLPPLASGAPGTRKRVEKLA